MAKKWSRICAQCGTQDYTFSKGLLCQKCIIENKKSFHATLEKEKLIMLGYSVVAGPTYNKFGKREYDLIKIDCGHSYTARYDNIISCVNRNGYSPCLTCGAKDRISKCLTGFKAKYGRDYATFDHTKFKDYKVLVRAKSEATYKKIKDDFTDQGKLERGKYLHHLDHKVPIKVCFDNGISVETASSKDNLSLIPWDENLKKSWFKYDDNVLKTLLERDKKLQAKKSCIQFCSNITYYLLQMGVTAKMRNAQYIIFENSNIKLKILKNDESQEDIDDILTYYIREEELIINFDLVMSRIIQLIGKSKRIFARNCEIVELDSSAYSAFCTKNHSQGTIGASTRLGLIEKNSNELVAVLSLGRPRFTKQSDFELLRYCNKLGTTVVGGASKLFNHFNKSYPGVSVISYADKRWSRGGLYYAIGFKLLNETTKSFYYIKNNQIISRYQAQKHKLKDLLPVFVETESEITNMTNAGYQKVYNPGQYVFGWNIT